MVDAMLPFELLLLRVMVFPIGSVSESDTPDAIVLPSVSAYTVPPILNVEWQAMQSLPGLCWAIAEQLIVRSNVRIIFVICSPPLARCLIHRRQVRGQIKIHRKESTKKAGLNVTGRCMEGWYD